MLLVSFGIINIVGHFYYTAVCLNFENKSVSLFFKQFLGIVVSIVLFALITTKGNTVFFIALLLLLSLFFVNKKEVKTPFNFKLFEFKQFAISSVFLAAFFFIFFFFYYQYNNAAVFGDNHFYANVAMSLNKTGIETTNFDWTENHLKAVAYHYSESWFVAMFSKLFNLLPLAVYYLFYTTIFCTVVLQGAIAIASQILESSTKKAGKLFLYFVSILFLFLQLFDNPFNSKTILIDYFYVGYPLYNIKYAIIYIVFQASVLAVLNRKFAVAFVLILLLVPLYSTIIPAILSGLALLLFFLWYKKQLTRSQFLIYFLSTIAVALFFVLFYVLQKGESHSNALNIEKLTISITKIDYIVGFLLVLSVIGLLLFYIVKKYIIKKKSLRTNYVPIELQYILASYIVFGIGAIIGVFLVFPVVNSFSHDAFQLLSNFIIPYYTVLFFVVILFILNRFSNKIKYSITCILMIYFVLLCYKNPADSLNMSQSKFFETTTDVAYFNTIKQTIQNDANPKFAFFRDYSSKNVMYAKTFLFMPDNRIAHFTKAYVPISLSAFDLPIHIDLRYSNKEDFSFYKFVQNQKENATFLNLEISTQDFINKYNIEYIIIEKNAKYPSSILKNAKTFVSNKVNGNLFLKL